MTSKEQRATNSRQVPAIARVVSRIRIRIKEDIHEDTHTRSQRPHDFSAWPGLHGHERFLRRARRRPIHATIRHALDAGISLLDTADMYGPHTNERLVGGAIQGRRDEVMLATKFGIVRDPSNRLARGIDGSPAYVRASCEGSLKRLGVERIDLYYQHRVDPKVPIEETVGAMSELVT
jgi:aryl-alcohol dehydrogenase-like predicted oxidoreductase